MWRWLRNPDEFRFITPKMALKCRAKNPSEDGSKEKSNNSEDGCGILWNNSEFNCKAKLARGVKNGGTRCLCGSRLRVNIDQNSP
jgi:hypothetical protein